MAETRKKIIRTVISEIVVDVVVDSLELLIHWQGGDHTRLGVKKNKFGHTRWVTDTDIVDLVRALSRHMPDHAIAMVLNRSGKTTTHGHSWTRGSVCSLRHNNDIAIHRPGERAERGEATINARASRRNGSRHGQFVWRRSSSRPIWLRCTSSGPSARRSVRALA